MFTLACWMRDLPRVSLCVSFVSYFTATSVVWSSSYHEHRSCVRASLILSFFSPSLSLLCTLCCMWLPRE